MTTTKRAAQRLVAAVQPKHNYFVRSRSRLSNLRRLQTKKGTRQFSQSGQQSPFERVSGKIVADPDSKLARRVNRAITCDTTFIQVLENELRENSAGALGRAQRALDSAYDSWMSYRELNPEPKFDELRSSPDRLHMVTVARTHNDLRHEALRRRDDLIIQRQACGFRLKSSEIITKAYPIPPAWSER